MKMEVRLTLRHGMTWAEVLANAEAMNVPPGAVLATHVTPGDRPWESETTTLLWTWGVELPVDDGKACTRPGCGKTRPEHFSIGHWWEQA